MQFKYKASMTIEITLLMPFIIGVFLFLFFTMYYLHDIVTIGKGSCTAVLRGGLEKDEDKIISCMTEASSAIRLLGKWDISENCGYDEECVKIDFDGSMEAGEGLFRKLIRGDYIYTSSLMSRRIDEVTYIRKRRK